MFSHGTYYGDGSGGSLSEYPSLRRCGFSIATLDQSDELAYGVYSRLPGKDQTVPRAETYALLALVSLAQIGATQTYVTDHKN